MGKNSNLDDVEKEYDDAIARLFSEVGKCASGEHCTGNTYYTRGEEFVAGNGKKYCSERCYEHQKVPLVYHTLKSVVCSLGL